MHVLYNESSFPQTMSKQFSELYTYKSCSCTSDPFKSQTEVFGKLYLSMFSKYVYKCTCPVNNLSKSPLRNILRLHLYI